MGAMLIGIAADMVAMGHGPYWPLLPFCLIACGMALIESIDGHLRQIQTFERRIAFFDWAGSYEGISTSAGAGGSRSADRLPPGILHRIFSKARH